MVFQVPASKAAEDRFEFELEGKSFSLPRLDRIPLETGMLFQQEKPLEALLSVAGDDDELSLALRRLHADQVGPLVEAWSEAAESELGE